MNPNYLQNIPKDWQVKKLKYLFDFKKGRNPKETVLDNKNLPIYLAMDYLRGKPKTIFYVKDVENCLTVNENDVLLLWDGSNAGEFIKAKNGILSSTMAVLRPKLAVDEKFTWFLLKNFELALKQQTVGMGIPHVNPNFLYNYGLLIPPLPTQKKIAQFLDKKTSEIDTLVTKKNKLIKLLQEEQKAFINEKLTDTEGTWKKKKLKYVVQKIGSGVTPKGGSEIYLNEGVMFLRSQNIYFEGLKLNEVVYISDEINDSMQNSQVKKGDVLLNITGASLGRCYFWNTNQKANVNQHVCIIRPDGSKLNTSFLYLLLRSFEGQRFINFSQNGSNREGLNFHQISNFCFTIPSLSTQQKIVQEIETHLEKTSSVIEKLKKEVALLKEYRQSVINEAVTGQVIV